jgi:hypothetical protein
MMDNPAIFKDSHFTITKDMFISGNTRFAISHLCSIKLIKTKRQIPYTLLVIELLLIATGLLWDFRFHELVSLLGVAGLVVNALIYALVKPVHKLILTFASGEKEVIGAKDYPYLEGLANAFSRTIEETDRR